MVMMKEENAERKKERMHVCMCNWNNKKKKQRNGKEAKRKKIYNNM